MTAWNERVRADVAATAPEPPELPRRRRVLGHGVLLKDRPGQRDELTDNGVRTFEQALAEKDGWNRSLTAGRAVVVELREVQC